MLKPGDVILFQGKSFVSRGIMWFTDSEYSHAALYVGDGYIIEATAAGVEKNRLDFSHCSSYCIRRAEWLTDGQISRIVEKAYALIYDEYDMKQLFTLGAYYFFRKLGITWAALVANMPNRMICSELVAVCYLTIPMVFREKTKLVTPDTLYTTTLLKTVIVVA